MLVVKKELGSRGNAEKKGGLSSSTIFPSIVPAQRKGSIPNAKSNKSLDDKMMALQRKKQAQQQQQQQLQVQQQLLEPTTLAIEPQPQPASTNQFKVDEGQTADSREEAGMKDENRTVGRAKSLVPQKKPKGMSRAKIWSPEVEHSYRYQLGGWRDGQEYLASYGEPECWPEGLVRCLQNKKSGFFMYFRQTRECEDKHLNKVKIYSY